MLAIGQVCAERQLAKEVVLEAVEAALVTAYKRNFGAGDEITARIDPETGVAQVFAQKVVSEDIQDPKLEITLEEARAVNSDIELGETVLIETTPKTFGRIAAQTAKQVILQRIREAERDVLYGIYAEQEGEIVNGTVQRIDSQVVIVNLGKAEGTLPRSEQIPGERYRMNQRLRAYVMEVEKSSRGPRIILSRNHRNMLRRLMELEVPEIFNGAVEIKAIAREPGARSKVAVFALRAGVDPVGSCVGMRGTRIQGIVNELGGEKIDVVEWNAELGTFISNALSPAQVVKVHLAETTDGKTATVIVPDKQLSLAIGKEGQNARLAAKLTGWRIDIKSASEAAEEVFAFPEPILKPAEEAEGDLLVRAEAILSAQLAEEASLERALEAEVQFGEEGEQVATSPADDASETVGDVAAEEPVEHEIAMAEAEEASEDVEVVAEQVEEQEVPEDEVEPEEDYDEELDEEYDEEEYEEGDEEVDEETDVVDVEAEFAQWSDSDESDEDEEDETGGRKKRKHWNKKHALVFDENAGKVVAKRKRKPSRRQDVWGEDDD